ncbi:MAG: hypothetical protein ACI9AA_003914 [Alteromonas sp.]|jgi:hypothetical protein
MVPGAGLEPVGKISIYIRGLCMLTSLKKY